MERNIAPESTQPQRRWGWKHIVYPAAAIALPAIAVLCLAFWYAGTPQFVARVQRTVVSTLEHVTGGKVEIRSFRWSVRHLAIEVDDLTIHGKEGPGQVPYFHVDHLTLNAKIVSFFTPKVALASLYAEHPVFHLILYPDGTTNQPQPRTASKGALPETLLDLAIDQTRIEDGLVLLNDRKIPWEMAAGPLRLTMQYGGRGMGYEALLETRNITFRLKNENEVHSQLRANFRLAADQFEIETLDLRTGNSYLTATGQLQNFAHPIWHLHTHGSADAREIGAIFGQEELRNGTAQLNIAAQGSPGKSALENFRVTGHLDLRGGEWESDWLRLRNVEFHTNLIVDNDQCSFTQFSSVLEDQGRIAGSLVMRHCIGPSKPAAVPAVWQPRSSNLKAGTSKHIRISPRELLRRLHQPHASALAGPEKYQPLQADLQAQVTDITLPFVLHAVAPRQYWNIGFTTATSGKVTARWTADGDGLDVHGDLTMRSPTQTMGLVPIYGSAHADYLGDRRHVVIEQADETTPATKVHAAGTLTLLTGDPNTNVQLDAVGRNLGEFDRLLTVLDLRVTPNGEAHTLPVNLLGAAGFHGNVHGSFFALEAVGQLDSEKFQMVAARASHTAAPPVEHLLAWDAFHANLAYTPSQLVVRNAELVRGHSVIHTAFQLNPDRTAPGVYTYDGHTRIAAEMQTANASLADLSSVIGKAYPASGTLTATAHLSGFVDDLQGEAHLGLKDGTINGMDVPIASIQMSIGNHVLEASSIQLSTAAGAASGYLSYNYASQTLQGELTGQHITLQRISVLQRPRFSLGGDGSFHMRAEGPVASPTAVAAIQIDNLSLNHQPMGQLHAEAHLQNKTLAVTSRAELLDTHVDAAGKVLLAGNDPAQAQLTFSRFDIAPLLQMANISGIDGTSSLEGRVAMSGPLKQPSAIQADADLQAFTVTVSHHLVHSVGPLRLSLRNGLLQMDQVRLQGQNVDLLAGGSIDLLNRYRLRLHSEGSIDAALIATFVPTVQSSGQVRFTVNARGTARQPDLRGSAQVKNVNLHMTDVTNGLTNMNGEMLFDQDRMVVQRLTGSSGGGSLDVKGFIGYRNGVFVDLTATSKDVRIRYPKGVSSSADAKLRLLGTPSSLMVSGNVLITRFGVGSSFDLAALAGGGKVTAPIDPSSPLNHVRLDIRVTSAPQLGFQNSFASLAGEVNLRVGGTLENPSILGRIDISEGSASFAGTKYRLQQGDIVFNNPVTISPEIDIEASARVQNYDIIISLHGPPDKLDISYRSEPPLTQADVLALLALGRTNEQAIMYGEQQQANANLTSEALLGGALNAAVSSRVQKLFGVGSVRVDPNFVGTLGQSTARVTVEEQVGPSVTLTFATNVNTTEQQLIQAQFDLTRNVSIIAVRDEADVFSMYLQFRGKHK